MECRTYSQIKWRLLPRFARSVGLGPVCSPQKLRALNNCRQQHATSRFGHHVKASLPMRNGSNPKFRPPANRANAASRSCRSRTPALSAASAREFHFGARKRYLRDKPGLSRAVGRLRGLGNRIGRGGSIKRHDMSGTSTAAMRRSSTVIEC